MIIVLHLKDLDIDVQSNSCNRKISLPANVIYVGKAFSNVESSILYGNLPIEEYKPWLKAQIEAKTDVYQMLLAIKQQLMINPDVKFILLCDCHEEAIGCQATTIKRAVGYLVMEDLAFGLCKLS
jgi:hypothetical protein